MKKVVVTAANCFIGRRLVKKLTENEYFVYAVVRAHANNLNQLKNLCNIKIIYCDMENYADLPVHISEQCDIGISLAWDGTRGLARSDKSKQEKNFNLSILAIKSFVRLGCTTIMTAGSQAEIGPWSKPEKVKETDECHPNTEYGKAKLRLYESTKTICKEEKIRFIEPRFFSLYGEDDYEGTMIISMIRNMLQNRPCDLTQCIQLWDFLYIDDAVEALFRLIESKTEHGVFHFGSGSSRPLKEYVEQMHVLTNSNSELHFGAVPYPPTGIVHTNPDIRKLMSAILWKPAISFEEGIKRVIRYQRKGTL